MSQPARELRGGSGATARAGSHSRARVIAAAARRFAVLLLLVGAGSAGLGALIAFATDTSARRGTALGLYAVGAFCALIGAGLALRNSLQRGGPGGFTVEAREAPAVDRELAGILIALGLLLLVFGIAIDPRAQLV